MNAFYGQQAIKDRYLARVRAHRAADEVIHGSYWHGGKGCAVGCTIHGSDHGAYERELGIPRLLAHLEDALFENLAPPEDQAWPERFLEAIPVGACLDLIWPQWIIALMAEPHHGVLQLVQEYQWTRQRTAIEAMVALYRTWVDTGSRPAGAAEAAEAAGAAGAARAARAARVAWAAEAAEAARVAWAAWAAGAAGAAWAAGAAGAARARQWQAETLLELLRAAPVSVGTSVAYAKEKRT